MLCLFQCQSDSALTRTYWSSSGTAGRDSRFKLFLLLILGAFSFVLSAILNSQASYRCTLVPRLPFPVPRSPFPVLVTSGNYKESTACPITKVSNCSHFHIPLFFCSLLSQPSSMRDLFLFLISFLFFRETEAIIRKVPLVRSPKQVIVLTFILL